MSRTVVNPVIPVVDAQDCLLWHSVCHWTLFFCEVVLWMRWRVAFRRTWWN